MQNTIENRRAVEAVLAAARQAVAQGYGKVRFTMKKVQNDDEKTAYTSTK